MENQKISKVFKTISILVWIPAIVSAFVAFMIFFFSGFLSNGLRAQDYLLILGFGLITILLIISSFGSWRGKKWAVILAILGALIILIMQFSKIGGPTDNYLIDGFIKIVDIVIIILGVYSFIGSKRKLFLNR